MKKSNEKLQKDLTEVKKENKKRKKLIETQQTLMNASASNYHQVSFENNLKYLIDEMISIFENKVRILFESFFEYQLPAGSYDSPTPGSEPILGPETNQRDRKRTRTYQGTFATNRK